MKRMVNLLTETTEELAKHGVGFEDVLQIFVGGYRKDDCGMVSIDDFKVLADFIYDAGYGTRKVKPMKIIGMDFVMVRREYDGSEWWEFISTAVDRKLKPVCSLEED